MNSDKAPRIKPLTPGDWDDEILDALGAFPGGLKFVLTGWEEEGKAVRGTHMLGSFAQYPALAKAFLTFNNHVATNSTLSARERELIILRIGWLRRCEYEFVMHLILGRRAGLTDEEMQRIEAGPDAAGWSEEDADLVRVADELHADARIRDETWDRLSGRYDHRQLMDMVFLTGCYEIVAMAVKSFGIPPEAEVAPLIPEITARMLEASAASTA